MKQMMLSLWNDLPIIFSVHFLDQTMNLFVPNRLKIEKNPHHSYVMRDVYAMIYDEAKQ